MFTATASPPSKFLCVVHPFAVCHIVSTDFVQRYFSVLRTVSSAKISAAWMAFIAPIVCVRCKEFAEHNGVTGQSQMFHGNLSAIHYILEFRPSNSHRCCCSHRRRNAYLLDNHPLRLISLFL
jgi:hypothetical protein